MYIQDKFAFQVRDNDRRVGLNLNIIDLSTCVFVVIWTWFLSWSCFSE
jgi:hypothetical protein